MNADRLFALYDRVAEAPDSVDRLRRFVLDLAVRGKLVKQDPADEPASALLRRISAVRTRLVKAGEIKPRKLKSRLRRSPVKFVRPRGWELTDLSSTSLKITDGAHKTPTYVGSGVPFVSVKDFSGGRLDLSNTRFIPRSEHQVLYRRCDPRRGDILLARIGTLGKAVLVDTDLEFSLFVSVALIRFDHTNVDPLYSRIVLNSPLALEEFNRIKVGGATHTNKLNLGDLHTVAFPLPPLAEQRRIVAKVNELMALCDQLEEARTAREDTRDRLTKASLTRLVEPDIDARTFRSHARFAVDSLAALTARADQVKQLRQTILNLAVRGRLVEQDPQEGSGQDVHARIMSARLSLSRPDECRNLIEGMYSLPSTWAWGQLGDVIVAGPRNGLSPRPSAREDAPRAVTLSATTSGTFDSSHFKRVDANIGPDSEFWLRPNDLLFQRGNTPEYVGMAAIYDGPPGEFIFPDLMIRVRLSPEVNLRFVHLFCVSPAARNYFSEKATGAQKTMPKINQTILRALPLPLPPLAEQHRIVAKVDELMVLCDGIEVGLTAAAEARRCLLESLLHTSLVSDEVSTTGRFHEVVRMGP